jgi:hypothetical protein
MAQQRPTIDFEDVPLDEARRTGRGPRMDQELSQELRQRIQTVSHQAVRMTIPEATRPTTMNNRLLRMAAELNIPVTIRKISGGLLFWRSTDEDLTHTKAVAKRLQHARKPAQTTRRGRPRRA